MNHPIATIEMENGAVMTAELYPEKAPQSVYNFISLANSGFYVGLRRLPRGNGHGRPRLLHQGRIPLQWRG